MRHAAFGIALSAVIVAAGDAQAQAYPVRPVRIVTTEVGSGNDLVARLIAPGVGAALGQQFVVDNRGILASEIVAKAVPDGHTLLVTSASFGFRVSTERKASVSFARRS